MHRYEARITWVHNGAKFSDNRYSRGHEWSLLLATVKKSVGYLQRLEKRPVSHDAESHQQLRILIALGTVLGLMNASFYESIARLPLSTVGAIEFIGPILLAALGSRTRRNVAALILAAGGGWVLTDVRFAVEPLGYLFAFANCALFILCVVLGHRIAQDGGTAGINRLGMAMLIAMITVSPIGFTGALPALQQPHLLLAGVGVGICSSVIPYVCDQLAMAQLPRASSRSFCHYCRRRPR